MSFFSQFTTPSPVDLMTAAVTIHTILTNYGIPHAFFGGFVMSRLNQSRHTGSVDIEIKRPMFGNWSKVFQLLKVTGQYHVLEGNNAVMLTENDNFTKHIRMRLIDITAGVQIFVFERSRWNSISFQNIGGLPAHSTTDLFISKVKCCGRRHHLADLIDISILYNLHRNSLDEDVIRRKLTLQDGARAVRRHPRNHFLFSVMYQLNVLPKWYDSSQKYEESKWCCF